MIVCTKCGSNNWTQKHRCILDPANDRFTCNDCGHTFKRYDPKLIPSKCVGDDQTKPPEQKS